MLALEAGASRVSLPRAYSLPSSLARQPERPTRPWANSPRLHTRAAPAQNAKCTAPAVRSLCHEGSTVLVEAMAGEPWHAFVLWTLAQGLSGLENLSLIPGFVGAAPVQNVGAYGVETADTLDSVTAIDTRTGEPREFPTIHCFR